MSKSITEMKLDELSDYLTNLSDKIQKAIEYPGSREYSEMMSQLSRTGMSLTEYQAAINRAREKIRNSKRPEMGRLHEDAIAEYQNRLEKEVREAIWHGGGRHM